MQSVVIDLLTCYMLILIYLLELISADILLGSSSGIFQDIACTVMLHNIEMIHYTVHYLKVSTDNNFVLNKLN